MSYSLIILQFILLQKLEKKIELHITVKHTVET